MTRVANTLTCAAATALAVSLLGCGAGTDSGTNSSAASGSSASASSPSQSASSASAPSPSQSVGQPPKAVDLAKTAAASVKQAKSVRIRMTSGADQLELAGNTDGSNQTFSMTRAGQGTMKAVTVDGATYLKGDKTFYTTIGQPDQPTDKWLKFTADEAKSAGVQSMSELTSVFEPLSKEFDDPNTEASADTVDGQPAWKVTMKEGEIWFGTDDRHLPLKLADDELKGTFAQWDAVERFTAPPASEIYTG